MENKKKINKKKVLLPIVFITIIYFIGFVIFSKYTYPLTYLNDERIGLKPINLVFSVDKQENIYIYDKNKKEYILNPSDLDFSMKYEKEISIDQNSYMWPIELLNENKIYNPLIKNVNVAKLNNWIKNSEFMKDLQKPVDAKIVKEENTFIVEDEIIGDKLDLEKVYKDIEVAYENSETEITLNYEKILPKIFKKDLIMRADYFNKLSKIDLSIILPDDSKEKLDIEEFAFEDKNEIDEDKIKEYVIKLKEKYDNVKQNREFTNFNGEKITVQGGNYGIQINLKESTAVILNEIRKSSTENNEIIELVYTSKAANGGEIGTTYVEISISDQRMVFYKDGNVIVDTPIVTGLPNGYYNTPRGVYNVWVKETSRYLQGKNLDGSKYKSWVNYWMQVDYTGVGIHDASWQSSFGGQRYKWAGSHGCINTPYNAVKTIYNNIDFGTPVIIY